MKAHGLLHDRKTAGVYDDDLTTCRCCSLEHDYIARYWHHRGEAPGHQAPPGISQEVADRRSAWWTRARRSPRSMTLLTPWRCPWPSAAGWTRATSASCWAWTRRRCSASSPHATTRCCSWTPRATSTLRDAYPSGNVRAAGAGQAGRPVGQRARWKRCSRPTCPAHQITARAWASRGSRPRSTAVCRRALRRRHQGVHQVRGRQRRLLVYLTAWLRRGQHQHLGHAADAGRQDARRGDEQPHHQDHLQGCRGQHPHRPEGDGGCQHQGPGDPQQVRGLAVCRCRPLGGAGAGLQRHQQSM